MFKKLVSLVLVFAIVVAFAGCGSKKDGGKKETGGSETLAENFGGRTVTLAGISAPKEDSPTYTESMEFIASLEKKYDCKIEFYESNDWASFHQEILKKALAGEKFADAFVATGVNIFPKWALNDLVAPLDEYFDFTNPIWNQAYNEDMVYNGQHYGISNWSSAIGNVILFNKKLCAANGISAETLYKEFFDGKWTWDKMIEYAKKCTKIGSNDDNSTYGFMMDNSFSPLMWLYSNGSTPVLRDGNTYKYNLNSPDSIAAIQHCYDLVYKHKVTAKEINGTGATLFKKGKVAFFATAMWAFPSYVDSFKDSELGVLLYPKGPKAKDYVNVTDTPAYWFIQPMVEDKALVAQLVTEYNMPQEWQDSYNPDDPDGGYLYDPAKAYEEYVFDDESLEVIRTINDKTIVEQGGVSTDFLTQILWGDFGISAGTDPRTWAESNAATGQYYLDSVWSQEFSVVETE